MVNYACVFNQSETGKYSSYGMGSKTVFFGVLRFLSSLRLEVFGSVPIQTAFYVMLQYGTI